MSCPAPVRYCWVCDEPADPPVITAWHYEKPDRVVYFCSFAHQAEYMWLRSL